MVWTRLIFQIGGMTQETHEIYRVSSHFDRVLTRLKETIRLERIHNSKPLTIAGFIVMKHNDYEVEEFKRKMSQLVVDRVSIINPCVHNIFQGDKFLSEDKKCWDYNIDAFKNGSLKPNLIPKKKCDTI